MSGKSFSSSLVEFTCSAASFIGSGLKERFNLGLFKMIQLKSKILEKIEILK